MEMPSVSMERPHKLQLGDQLMQTGKDPWTDKPRARPHYAMITDFWYDPTRIEHRRTYDREAAWMMAVQLIARCGTPCGPKRAVPVKGMRRAGWSLADRDAVAEGFAIQEALDSGKVIGLFQKPRRWHK